LPSPARPASTSPACSGRRRRTGGRAQPSAAAGRVQEADITAALQQLHAAAQAE
jgi:hypothetical protein